MDDGLLTNREIAGLVVFLGTLILFVLFNSEKGKTSEALLRVVDFLSKPQILVPLVLYFGWITIAVAGAARVGLWNFDLLKTTILWLIVSGLIHFLNLNDAIEKRGFFRAIVMKSLGVVAFIEFLSTLKSFPLWVELPIQALALVFAMLAVFAEHNPKRAPARNLAIGYLVILGICALVWSVVHLVVSWPTLDLGKILREFLLPIWLTIIVLPFLYGLAVFAAYQPLFIRMRFSRKEGSLVKSKTALLLRVNGRLGMLRQISGANLVRVAKAETFRDAWKEIGRIQDEDKQRRLDEAEKKRRLVEYAGVTGTDESGCQLDQREFDESRKALSWIASCQMGQFRNRGEKYSTDVLKFLEPESARFGLSENHRIEVYITDDRQGWYATRQTITGWWFAIGATAPPSDQWLYDGPSAPKGFPREPEWDHFGNGPASVNWN